MTQKLCLLHYTQQPCDECAYSAFVHRVSSIVATGTNALGAPAVIIYKPLVIEHMFAPWETPRSYDTPDELMRATHERGVESEYLRDSSLWRSRPPREV